MSMPSPILPRAAGEAAQLQRRAREYFAQDVATMGDNIGTFPGGGYVVFFEGKPCGWMRSLDRDKAENGRLTHRPGCIAVTVDGPAHLWDAVGGDYWGGAERWEPRAALALAKGGAS